MKEMTYLEFAAQRDDRGLRLIDVREQDEYDAVHVHGAELFPLSKLEAGELPEEDDRNIVLICRSGARSARAAQILESRGFEETINIKDGTLGAVEAGEEHVEYGA